MGVLTFLKKCFTAACLLASTASGYNVQDLHTLNLQIAKSTGDVLSFDLTLNEDNQFSATIQNLDAGLTNITLNGYDSAGTRMYNGDWEGQVRQDGKPTQVELFMTDLKPDIDVATLSNIAPFFLSIEMEPSNIAKNETVYIKTRAKDLDDAHTALNYSFRPLSPLFGNIYKCANGSEYCTMQYRSDMQDTNGVKDFEIDVSDGVANDTVKGGFNIRAYGGVNLIINFNNRPGVSYISTDNSFLYDDVGHDSLQVNLTLFDDNYVDWEWDVEGTDPACDVMGLTGDVQGQYALQKDISIVFQPFQYIESECKLSLLLRDVDDPALTYQLEIPFYVGNKLYNTAPYISTGYSTASTAHPGTTITYVIFARDKGNGVLQATWDVTDAGTILEMSSSNSTSGSTPSGFSQYTFIMKLNATGQSGNVRCTVEDAFQLSTQLDFTVGTYVSHDAAITTTTTSTPLPTTTTTTTASLVFREEGSRTGNCAPARMGIYTSKESAAAACEASQTSAFPCTAVYRTPSGSFETRRCGAAQISNGWCFGYPAVTMMNERCDTGHTGDETFFYRYLPPLTTTTTSTTTTTTTSTPSTTTSPTLNITALQECAAQIGFVDARNTLNELINNGGCSSAPGFYADGCSIYQTGLAQGDICHAMARTSSSCTLQGCDGQDPPECDQSALNAQGTRVTTRSWAANSFSECADACTATMNSYWHGIYIKQCETGCVVQACETTTSRRLNDYAVSTKFSNRRLLESTRNAPVVNPYVFGLSMSIADRTLKIQSNTVPQPRTSNSNNADLIVPEPGASSDSSSPSHTLPISLGIGGGMLALLVGAAYKRSRKATVPPTDARTEESI